MVTTRMKSSDWHSALSTQHSALGTDIYGVILSAAAPASGAAESKDPYIQSTHAALTPALLHELPRYNEIAL